MVRGAAARGARAVAVRGAAILAALALTIVAPAAAQRGRGQAPAADGVEPPAGSPAEIQRMFDSYALIQAQDQLKISDEKFPQFLGRFKALQDTRRRNIIERFRLVQELRRLANDPQADEAQIKDRLKALDDLDARTQADTVKAYEAVNQVLDVRQQAKFRVFEENMERRKLELVTRARQANRPPKQ
jgi:Spy/CpxP family protein refolding chaperone